MLEFDYGQLAFDDRACAQSNAKAIHELNRNATECVVEIGRRLGEVRKVLGTKFRAWMNAEFQWGQSTASNYMQVAARFGHLDCLDQFQPSALAELSRGRVADEAVTEAIGVAQAGEVVTRKRVQQIVARHAPTGTAAKPESLYQLRAALKRLSGDLNGLVESVPRNEVMQLADDLIDFARQLRAACDTEEKPTAASHPKTKRKRATVEA